MPVPATMDSVVAAYHDYVDARLAGVRQHALTLKAVVGNADTETAMQAWLAAQQEWQRVGAAYGSFRDLGTWCDEWPRAGGAGPLPPRNEVFA